MRDRIILSEIKLLSSCLLANSAQSMNEKVSDDWKRADPNLGYLDAILTFSKSRKFHSDSTSGFGDFADDSFRVSYYCLSLS